MQFKANNILKVGCGDNFLCMCAEKTEMTGEKNPWRLSLNPGPWDCFYLNLTRWKLTTNSYGLF